MKSPIQGLIQGLHHVTATVDDPKADYAFYVDLLGLRLVKKTVNFDNERVFHFYYANKIGEPSTVMTTFPYAGQGVRKGVIGAGQVGVTAFSIPKGVLTFWKARLMNAELSIEVETFFDKPCIMFKDPSGLLLRLIEDEYDVREPIWITDQINENQAIRGIHHAELYVREKQPTAEFLSFMGYQEVAQDKNRSVFEIKEGGAGKTLVLMADAALPVGKNGIGTVHHVAHCVASTVDSLKIKKAISERFGITATEVKDRKYFESIYFRIPGGILFELATAGPGFLVDEEIESLGNTLMLPEWQEPRRALIEEKLSHIAV